MKNADHAPFYFSRKFRHQLASDADDPTATEVRNAGTPTGETGREAEDDEDYSTPEGARRALSSERLATDPSVSEPQRRAMQAAAAGKSTIGIPKSVGQEFTKADRGAKDWKPKFGSRNK